MSDRQPADYRRSDHHELVAALEDTVGLMAVAVAEDLGQGSTPADVEPVVRRFLALIATPGRIGPAQLARLRREGAGAVRAGVALPDAIDRYLSCAWVAWDRVRALAPPGSPELDALPGLGSVLLRAGDDIAAALAEGYTAAERAIAMQAGATRRAVLDEILTPGPGSAERQARLARRVSLIGLDPAVPYDLLVLRSTGEIDEDGVEVAELDRRLARDPSRRAHLVSVRGGDLLAFAARPPGSATILDRAVDGLAPDRSWWAVVSEASAIAELSGSFAEAVDALRIVSAIGSPGRVEPVARLTLERALVADPGLAAAAVERWLEPIAAAGRGADRLVPTLEAWLASGQSVTGAATALRVAPRTVSYRLARIAAALGRASLDPATRERLVTVLLVRRLLGAAGG